MSTFRSGKHATVGGRTFKVGAAQGGWKELGDDGRLVGPLLQKSDFERLVVVDNWARLDGVVVGVEAVRDDRARVSTLTSHPELVERWGLEGNPKDGWVGEVPLEALTDREERVEERRTGS